MSRIYREGSGSAEAFDWVRIEEPGPAGVQSFEPASSQPGAPASRPPPAAQAPASPTVDLEPVRKQAFQEGFAAGEESGRRAAAAEAETKIASLGHSIATLTDHKRILRGEVEREVVDLAFAVARRVLRRELNVDPQAAAGIVRSCLDETTAGEVRRVRVHPDEHQLIREAVGESVEVVADSAVARGGAVLETERGRLDAQIDTQLNEIEKGLTDR